MRAPPQLGSCRGKKRTHSLPSMAQAGALPTLSPQFLFL